MLLRRLLLLLVSLVLGLLISFSVVSINASADTVYTQMTVEDTYSFYGSEIDCVYYSTTGYKHVTLVPSPNHNNYGWYDTVYGDDIPAWIETNNLRYVVYYAQVSDYSSNPSYLGVSIEPNYHFSDCNAFRFCAASYVGATTVSAAAYNESFIRMYGQTELRYTNTPFIENNLYPIIKIIRSGGNEFNVLPVWCDYTSDTLSTVSMLQVGFNGVQLDSGEIDVYLSCPLVNDSAYGGSGVVTGTSVTGSGSGSVNVDLQQTNGLLSQIISSVSNLGDTIIDGVIGLFVPEEGTLDAFENALADLLLDTFGGVESDMLDTVILDLLTHGATESITWPAISVPGTNFSLPAYNVPLKPAALQNRDMYEGLALLVDLICTCWVLNLIMHNIKVFLVGEKVVEVEDDDN